jgi:hypothetical protein
MFHDVERPFERIYIFPFKKQFWRKTWKPLIYLLDVLKTTLVKSMKRYFKVSKGQANPFSAFWTLKIWIGVSCLSGVSITRMALRTNYLPAGRLKKLLWWSQWSDISMCRKTMRSDFLHPVHWKKRLGRCCLSGVLIGQIVWRKFVFLNVSKYYFSDVHEEMFNDVDRRFESIF